MFKSRNSSPTPLWLFRNLIWLNFYKYNTTNLIASRSGSRSHKGYELRVTFRLCTFPHVIAIRPKAEKQSVPQSEISGIINKRIERLLHRKLRSSQ